MRECTRGRVAWTAGQRLGLPQSLSRKGLGLAGLEAMAWSAGGGHWTVGSAEYVKDGVNGYLVDLSDGKVDVLASRLKGRPGVES